MKYDDNRKHGTAQVIKQRLQADSGNPVSVYNGPVHCARLTIKREGLRGLYTGILLALPTTGKSFSLPPKKPILNTKLHKNKPYQRYGISFFIFSSLCCVRCGKDAAKTRPLPCFEVYFTA